MSEADVHFELYRHLQNAIEREPDRGAIVYKQARSEYSEHIDGRADIVVFDTDDNPVFVVEAKKPGKSTDKDLDPYSPAVIRQAFGYAGDLGAPYFCTYNGDRLVVFNAFVDNVPLLERPAKSYTVSDPSEFADTLLSEVARLTERTRKWDSLDDIFIERVHSLHEYMTPRVQGALITHLTDDGQFRTSFVEWTASQGIDYEDADKSEREEIHTNFAEQAAYLLINKIIFYKILENSPTYAEGIKPLAVRPGRVHQDLEECFRDIVSEVDFEAIYEHDEIYSEIPLEPVEGKIAEFIDELDERDLTRFDSDVIGRIYEGVIPYERRREMGEYYTPPTVCDLITRLTVEDASDTVLDPACGSGGFLVSAYDRLKNLLAQPAGSHDRILHQLSGVEINRFPAHLTAINLALQDLSSHTEEVNVEIDDFFNVKKNQRLRRTKAGSGGTAVSDEITEQIGDFDVIVANPPYIRQENIKKKSEVRDHLSSREIDAEYVSKRADIYAYFITHATEFVADDGQLGFITSDRWLDTKYGEDVQQFILENYVVRAIIKFDRQVFDDALVDSSVLILQREDDQEIREQNVAKFLRLKRELDIEEIASIVEQETEPDKMVSNEDYRLVTARQPALRLEKKWNTFFFAPPIYFDIDAGLNVVQLSEVAEVSYGTKTGANPFFFGHTEDMVELGLQSYVSPAFKATGQIDRIIATGDDAAEWSILDVHHLVTEAFDTEQTSFGQADADSVKKWLKNNGHEALLEYIASGEASGYHERPVLSKKDIWFDLGPLPRPRILSTMFTWRMHRVFWNEAKAATSDQFYYIRGGDGVDEEVLCGILNSRIVWLANELLGRRAGGEGMTRLQTKVYETKQWPIPDPRHLTDEQEERIRVAFRELTNRERELDEPTHEALEVERDALDRAVIDTLGINGDTEAILKELKHGVNAMLDMREEGAGQRTTVLIERPEKINDETGVIELPGVASTHEHSTLDSFS